VPHRTADNIPAGLILPLVVCNSSKTKQKGGWTAGWCCGRTSDERMSKCTLNVVFEVMPEVQKDPVDVFSGIGLKK
jgi:hypothetical protein